MIDPDLPSVKAVCILMYAAFGAFCLFVACRYKLGRSGARFDTEAPRITLGFLATVAAGLLLLEFTLLQSYLLLAAVAIGTIFFFVRHAAWKTPLILVPATTAGTLALSLAWWRIFPGAAAPRPLAAFAVILGCLVVCLSDPGKYRPRKPLVFLSVFMVAGFLLLADLGSYVDNLPVLRPLAHHWGAFIGPALHLEARLVPFYDIPLQYGLGPSLVIAAACDSTNCWFGTECVVILMNLAIGLLILRMVLATAVPRGPTWQCAATIVVFAAVFLWPGYPSVGNGLLANPSVGGIRFLPATLVACLLFFDRPALAAAALVPAALWSPESAAMSITVFGLCETARVGFTRALLRTGGLLAGGYAGLVLLHRAVFGVWMDPAAFAEYVLHVPGPLPINPISNAMVLAAILCIGGWLIMFASPDQATARRDYTATVLLFAASSYWFGRSHPNNICNLMPFLVLVAFRALDRSAGTHLPSGSVMSFGLATSAAALAFSPWQSIPYDPRATVDIQELVADFRVLEPDIEHIREEIPNPDKLGIADFGSSYTRHASEKLIWTPMDPSSLWSFVPSERRQLYIRRSSARLRRSGWAIFDPDQHFLLDDLRAGYTVAMERNFLGAPMPGDGSRRQYLAVCFDPRPDIAGANIGPACPSESRPSP